MTPELSTLWRFTKSLALVFVVMFLRTLKISLTHYRREIFRMKKNISFLVFLSFTQYDKTLY